MAKAALTEEQAAEIKKLNESEYVKLARREQHLKYKERQYLYLLRSLEKRGKQLAADGVTIENIEAQIAELEFSTENE